MYTVTWVAKNQHARYKDGLVMMISRKGKADIEITKSGIRLIDTRRQVRASGHVGGGLRLLSRIASLEWTTDDPASNFTSLVVESM